MQTYIDENGVEQTVNEKKIVPLKRENFPALSGRSKRRLMRQNTVHLDGFCPECGSRCRWKKTVLKGYEGGKPVYLHDKWVCQNPECRKKWDRKDFTYVKRQYV